MCIDVGALEDRGLYFGERASVNGIEKAKRRGRLSAHTGGDKEKQKNMKARVHVASRPGAGICYQKLFN